MSGMSSNWGRAAWHVLVLLCFLFSASCEQAEKQKPSVAAVSAPEKNAAPAMPNFGAVTTVTTQATGYGSTLSSAVDEAILSAIRQVNGQSFDSSTASFRQAVVVTLGKDAAQLSSAEFAQLVTTRSRGAVTGFELISQQQLADKSFEVTIKANVAKFRKPDSASLVRIVVAPIRNNSAVMIVGIRQLDPNAVEDSIRSSISSTLTKTQRFTVLDREFNSDVNAELEVAQSPNAATEDYAKLGQTLATDLILIGSIDQFGYERHEQKLRTSGRALIGYSGGAALSYKLINVATREVVMMDRVQIVLPGTAPTTLPTYVDEGRVTSDLSLRLSEAAARSVVTKFFPITVVDMQGEDVVLSQGAEAVRQGKLYHVYLMGKQLHDPQSGRPLGRMESDCCVVEVTRVTGDLAYGRLKEKKIELPISLSPGLLEVREEVMGDSNARNDEHKEVAPGGSGAAAVEAPHERDETTSTSKPISKADSSQDDRKW